ARVGQGTLAGRADVLRIAPQRAGVVVVPARLPDLAALGQRGLVDFEVDGARFGVDRDHVAVHDQRDRPAFGRLGPDVSDAEAARRAGEAPVGDQRDALAHALAIERRSRREHLAHAGAALGALV